jgi:hypothetical protein
MPNNDYKKGIKTESSNQYTSYVLSKLSIIFFSTLAVNGNLNTLFAFQDELVDRLLSIKDKIFLKH